MIGKFGPTPATRLARSAWASAGDVARTARLRAPDACLRAPPTAPPAALRTPVVRPSISSRPRPSSCSRSLSTSFVCLRPRWRRLVASPWASAEVMRPRSTASSSASSMRWRESSTISIGPIRFLRRASRNSATVLASTPAFLAGRDAVRAVVFAPLRAFCWRARAWPPFFAAALRLVEEAEPDELLRLRDDADDDRLLDARPFDALVLDERLLDELERFDPPPDLPVLRRSAIWP